MIKFLLVVKVCSALDGTCLPEQPVSAHETWFECAKAGAYETISLMDLIGKDLINRNKLFVAFNCEPSNDT